MRRCMVWVTILGLELSTGLTIPNRVTHFPIYWLFVMVFSQSFPMSLIAATAISYILILNSLPVDLTFSRAQQIHVTSLCQSDSRRIQCITQFDGHGILSSWQDIPTDFDTTRTKLPKRDEVIALDVTYIWTCPGGTCEIKSWKQWARMKCAVQGD